MIKNYISIPEIFKTNVSTFEFVLYWLFCSKKIVNFDWILKESGLNRFCYFMLLYFFPLFFRREEKKVKK